jgi:glycosyltransferase involved in cell wall biosynthesis
MLVVRLDDLKRRQAEWFDDEADPEYEIERPHGTPRFHAWLLGEKFRRSVGAVRPHLDGAVVLAVCAGSGMDAEFLAHAGARVVAADISLGAAKRARERARRHGVQIESIVADAEQLPFRDGSVDVVYVHDGLHHLERPLAGLAEMARVARSAVSVNEPARAAATALSVRLGYSGVVEEAGNCVERLLPGEVEAVLRERGFEIVRSGRYAMVYRHVAGRPVRFLSTKLLFPLARAGFRIANLLLGRIGNKLTVQAVRRARPRRLIVHDYAGHPFQVQLSRELARRGDQVLHLHCPSYPNGRGALERLPADPASFRSEPIPLSSELRKYSLWKRACQEVEYSRKLARRIHAFGADVVVSGNTPVVTQAIAQRACRRAGIPFVFWQQDVHGLAMQEIARARLPIFGGLVGAAFPALERRLLRRSDAVVPVTAAFLPILHRWGIQPERIRVIENWAPVDELPLHERENAWKREHGLEGRPLLLYSGTLGLKHEPQLLFELALAVSDRGARVIVASEGLGAEALRKRLRLEPHVDSLVLVPFQPYERLAEMMGAADVLLALLGRSLGAYSVPSKVLTYHCAGRPLLASIPAENPAARMIEQTGSGIVVAPEDVAAFVAGADRLLDDAALRDAMGARARARAERDFDIAVVADRFVRVLRRLQSPEELRAGASETRLRRPEGAR